ncbi:MAG: AzlC family ABC transporter permease, partial [Eubacteriales bacterium]
MVSKTKARALRAAIPYTLPILTGYLFLGFTLGILARTSGLPAWFPVLTACAVYAGSAEFVTVGLLSEPFRPLQTFMI